MARISFGGKSYDPRLPKLPKPKTPKAPKTSTVAAYVAPPIDESWKDQTYLDTTSGVTKNLDNLKGYLLNAGTGLGTDAGVSFDRDPANPLQATNFRIDDNVDVTNPFSRAALLKRSYQQATTGNTNSYAARGQLYSGALQNAQNETGRQKLQADDALIKDFSSKYGSLYQTFLEGQGNASAQTINAGIDAQGRHKDDPVPVTTWKNVAFKDTAAAGLKVEQQGNKLIVRDSKGSIIPGATVVVQGKRRFIRVPR